MNFILRALTRFTIFKKRFYKWHVACGKKKENAHNYLKAKIEYDKAILIDPEEDIAYLYRGNVKIKLGEYHAAKLDFESAIMFTPVVMIPERWCDPDSLIKYPGVYRTGQFGGQIQLLRPKIVSTAHFLKGNAEMMLENYEEAHADFDKVLELEQEHKEAYFNRGLVRYELQDYLGARQDWRKAGRLGVENAYRMIKEFCESYSHSPQMFAIDIIDELKTLANFNERDDLKNRWEEYCWHYQEGSTELRMWEDYIERLILSKLAGLGDDKLCELWSFTNAGQGEIWHKFGGDIEISNLSLDELLYSQDQMVEELFNLVKSAAADFDLYN